MTQTFSVSFFGFLFSMIIFATSSNAELVSVMSYNVENLFDTYHDVDYGQNNEQLVDKQDYPWLPLFVKESDTALGHKIRTYCSNLGSRFRKELCFNLDWTQEKLNKKLSNIARVIRYANNGKGADIVVFEEVEKISLLQLLVKNYLKDLGYTSIVLLEGPDVRGIDVGIISKYPLIPNSAQYHEINISDLPNDGGRPTRGILEARFDINGTALTILGNHWPSQSHTDYARERAAQTLAQILQKNKNRLTIGTGDFNTATSDRPHGINKWLLRYHPRGFFYDSEAWRRKVNPNGLPDGTHYYGKNKEWTSLDRIFLSESLMKSDNVSVNFKDFYILAPKFLLHDSTFTDTNGVVEYHKNVPQRFDPYTGEGFSDHLPIIMSLDIN